MPSANPNKRTETGSGAAGGTGAGGTGAGTGNLLAAALSRSSSAWTGVFQHVAMEAGETIVLQDVRPTWVYFPIDGMVSCLVNPTEMEATGEYGDALQVQMLGNEDLVGLQGLLGSNLTAYRGVVEAEGFALRVSADRVRQIIASDDVSRTLLLRYADMILAESWQLAGSIMSHKNEVRLATWLLRASQVLGDTALPFTQPLITKRLGIRRASLSNIVDKMEADKLIAHDRGRLRMLDMAALAEIADVAWPTMVANRREFTAELRKLAAG